MSLPSPGPKLNAASTFDTLIVGAGSMGMAAGYFLSKAGQKVLLLDAHDPPHESGAHHGGTRLIRHAYAEGAAYVPLALRAQRLWLALEREAETTVFARTGVVNIGRRDGAFMHEVRRSVEQYALSAEFMDGAQASRRWPAWRLPADCDVGFEPEAGVLFCESAVRSYRRLAVSLGATVSTDTPVARIEALGERGVCVETQRGDQFFARDLIVCAGKATQRLLASFGLRLPVTRVRKTFAWFEGAKERFGPEALTGFGVETAFGVYYGLPDIDGSGLKVGRHDGGQPVSEDDTLVPFGAEPDDLPELERFLHAYLPDAGALRIGKVCEYDVSTDEHFIVDRLPSCPQIQIATGFSGHGFKFASAIGQALAQRIVSGESEMDLSLFRLARFGDRAV